MDGWIFLDKPKNITSFKVIKRLKKILNIKKIGHTGTLDPFATGILAIALGEATKSIRYLSQDKVYKFNVVFGELKDTDDITGRTIKKSNIIPTLDEINQCIRKFIGKSKSYDSSFTAYKLKSFIYNQNTKKWISHDRKKK